VDKNTYFTKQLAIFFATAIASNKLPLSALPVPAKSNAVP
jgi:hypothetical protein